MRATTKTQGFLLVELTVGTVLVVGAIFFVSMSARSSRKTESQVYRKAIAEQSASELLEYFRSLSTTEMGAFLQQRPTYGLCSNVNVIDPLPQPTCAQTFIQPDAMADVSNPFLGGPVACEPVPCLTDPTQGCFVNRGVNRFYQVQVVNTATDMQRTPAACGAITHSLQSNERYLVIVGVSWFEPGAPTREQIQLSTTLMRHP